MAQTKADERGLKALRQLLPSGDIELTAIQCDREQPMARIRLRDSDSNRTAVAVWIAAKNAAGFNIYFTSAAVPTPPVKPKPRKDHCSHARALHIDLDPPPELSPDEYDGWRKEAAEKIIEFEYNAPTLLCSSGNGLQAFYRLSEPVPINAADEIDRLEDVNRGLGVVIGEAIGSEFDEGTQNADRLMRVPYTTNWPDQRKRDRGRVPTQATVLSVRPDRQIDYANTRTFENQGRARRYTRKIDKDRARARLDMPGDASKVTLVRSLAELGLPGLTEPNNPLAQAILSCAPISKEPQMWKDRDIPDRSRVVYSVCCALARKGVAVDKIAGVIRNPDFGISAIAMELEVDKGAEAADRYAQAEALNGYAEAMAEAAEIAEMPDPPIWDPEKALIWMRARHPIIQAGSGSGPQYLTYLHERLGETDRTRIVYDSLGALKSAYEHKQVQIGEDPKSGEPVKVDLGTLYRRDPGRKQYLSTGFEPGAPAVLSGNRMNLYRGWPIDPEDRPIPLLERHVLDVLAKGRESHAEYIWRWMAYSVQKLAQPQGVALVFKGGKRTGKGTLARTWVGLYGQHGLHTSNKQHLSGKFNAHLRDCLGLFADETFENGDKQGAATQRVLLTEPTLMFERKGVDTESGPNYLKVMMASNEEWVVPNTSDEERYAIFEVSDAFKNDAAYFGPLYAEMREDGGRGLLCKLLKMSLGDWQPWHDIPRTEARGAQIRATLDPYDQWIAMVLESGEIPMAVPDEGGWTENTRPKGRGPWGDGLWETAQGQFPPLRRDCSYDGFSKRLSRYFGKARGSGRGAQLAGVDFGVNLEGSRDKFRAAHPGYEFPAEPRQWIWIERETEDAETIEAAKQVGVPF
ncbi:hypothetical protein EI983_18740 [Roseovarius faecimaris]|uniref:NrS-1 polymerase-like helicase domain-containing protein n=1 Tax=Roseovarius faecimaris TaxID=2494550 RepID=A0A6I6ISY8_9RHOB|nr:primase-helicase family protein [Roseovarius faecimaris]QGY00190.1 hypothetical protein EI983_18740 [Roseovarius faecimaris]